MFNAMNERMTGKIPGKAEGEHSKYQDIFRLFREKYPGKKGGKHPFRKP